MAFNAWFETSEVDMMNVAGIKSEVIAGTGNGYQSSGEKAESKFGHGIYREQQFGPQRCQWNLPMPHAHCF